MNIHITAAIVLLCCLADGNTPCWSADWQYQRQLSFSSATTRANSVIGITLSTQTLGTPYQHFNADGSDLRFTTSDGTTPLSYWIESWNPTGESKVWVKVPTTGTTAIQMKFGNSKATSASAGAQVFNFFDDFNDGLWVKYTGNPVITRTADWETEAICEPSVLYENNTFKMWYMGTALPQQGKDAFLGYATSPDGLNWTKAANNPILKDPNQAIIRTTVVKNGDTYYLFACDYNFDSGPGNLWRWTSTDGLNWAYKTLVIQPNKKSWESYIENVGIAIDGNTWHMLYQCEGGGGKPCGMGYATSPDNGLTWTKHPNAVIGGPGSQFYGGDPALIKVGGTYYTWHSEGAGVDLRISCRKSADMVNWQKIGGGPQINYTQPWERGIGRPEAWWNKHLTDADLLEHGGKVWMYYQGAQCPLGVAWFDGTMAQLGQRLKNNDIPLRQWAASPYGMVENNQLKIADDGTAKQPLHENTAQFSDREGYTVQCRAQSYAGYVDRKAPNKSWNTPQSVSYDKPEIAVVMRYRDDAHMARFRVVDNQTTYYEEAIGGVWSKAVNLGANHACDRQWRAWRIDVQGGMNRLYIDGVPIGSHSSNAALCNRTDLQVGLSTQHAFAAFDDMRVTRFGLANLGVTVGAEVSRPNAGRGQGVVIR